MSQVAALQGESAVKSREKPLFWKARTRRSPKEGFHWVSYAIVDQQWKLVSTEDASYVELYDIVADPFEKSDLKEDQPEVVLQLLNKIEDWKGTLPDRPTGAVFSEERNR